MKKRPFSSSIKPYSESKVMKSGPDKLTSIKSSKILKILAIHKKFLNNKPILPISSPISNQQDNMNYISQDFPSVLSDSQRDPRLRLSTKTYHSQKILSIHENFLRVKPISPISSPTSEKQKPNRKYFEFSATNPSILTRNSQTISTDLISITKYSETNLMSFRQRLNLIDSTDVQKIFSIHKRFLRTKTISPISSPTSEIQNFNEKCFEFSATNPSILSSNSQTISTDVMFTIPSLFNVQPQISSYNLKHSDTLTVSNKLLPKDPRISSNAPIYQKIFHRNIQSNNTRTSSTDAIDQKNFHSNIQSNFAHFHCEFHEKTNPSKPCIDCFSKNYFGDEYYNLEVAYILKNFKNHSFPKVHAPVKEILINNTEIPLFDSEITKVYTDPIKSCAKHIFSPPYILCDDCTFINMKSN